MRTLDKLERAGWRFLSQSGKTAIMYRIKYRIFIDTQTKVAISWWEVQPPFTAIQLNLMSDLDLDIFCEKLENP